MLRRLFKALFPPKISPAAQSLYLRCVEQARKERFYAELRVPDTLEGRFDMLLLHVISVIRRLKEYPETSQQLFDILFADVDRNLRQMGVSDISIGKKMKPMLSAFYGRARAYEVALTATDDAPLADVLRRNVYDGADDVFTELRALTLYTRTTQSHLAEQKPCDLLAGRVDFPAPM